MILWMRENPYLTFWAFITFCWCAVFLVEQISLIFRNKP